MGRIGLGTDTFYGSLRFDTSTTTEPTPQTIASETVGNNTVTATTANASWSQVFTIASATKFRDVTARLNRGSGTPVGSVKYELIKDSALLPGTPSLVAADVLATSGFVSVQSLGLTITATDYLFSLNNGVLPAGTYHLVQTFDAAYLAAYNANNNNSVQFQMRTTGSSAPFALVLSGGIWVNGGSTNMYYTIRGRTVDLRVRVTSAGSPAYPCTLDGYGLFYGVIVEGAEISVKQQQRFVFNSTVDNLNSFTITAFAPDPDLLVCWYIEGGQGFKVPAFTLSGNVATFPVDSFNNGGISAPVTLIFEQNDGGSYDGSDSNARLLAENHLGSASALDDRSVSGRGVRLRSGAGVLVELAIDSDGIPVVISVP